MLTCTRPANNFTPDQLRFPPAAGFTVRADFAGGEVSSDLGALLLAAVDRRVGLMDRLTAAIADSRHASYIKHTLRDLLTQRVFQIASGYEDGNDANTLRRDPLFKLAAERAPLDTDNLLACGATHSRLEGSLRRSDIYCMARALVLQFIASYSCTPASITLDLDHTDDATYGQQALSFYNHHYGHHCYLPLLVFEANSGALVTAVLRPGKRPTGAENAMIMKRVLGLLRQHWLQTHIVLRGDGHFANPELMALIVADGNAVFIFGLGGNAVLSRKTEGLPGSCGVPDKGNERFVVTSMRGPSPSTLYQQDYCARGQAENWIKQVKYDLKADRTSASTFLANFGRLLLTGAAYVLHQQLRQRGLQGTVLATAQPKTVILSLFKIAVRVKQYKDRGRLHLPTACPVKALLATVCGRLYPPNSRVRTMLASP